MNSSSFCKNKFKKGFKTYKDQICGVKVLPKNGSQRLQFFCQHLSPFAFRGVPDGTPADRGHLSIPLLIFVGSFTQTETSFSLNKKKNETPVFQKLIFYFSKRGVWVLIKSKKNDVSFFNLFLSLF